MELKNKVVVITGGSRGFGRSLAEAFIAEGSEVAICALHEEELNKTAKDIGALPVIADVRNEEDMQKLLDRAIEKYGALDLWINNAGLWLNNENAELNDLSKVKDMVDVNVTGLIIGSIVALRKMKENKSGTIINILSGAGLESKPGIATYAATKWAGNGFTKSLRDENKDTGVSILTVFPGGMKTSIFGDYKYEDFDNFLDTKDVAARVIDNLKKEIPEAEITLRRQNV